jgi:hypothetical protein
MKLSTGVLNKKLSGKCEFRAIGPGKGRTFHVGVIEVTVTARALQSYDILE